MASKDTVFICIYEGSATTGDSLSEAYDAMADGSDLIFNDCAFYRAEEIEVEKEVVLKIVGEGEEELDEETRRSTTRHR